MNSLSQNALLSTMLNSLEAERHARAPLLLAILDEIEGVADLEVATRAARALLADLPRLDTASFAGRVEALRRAVRATLPTTHSRAS